MMTSLRRLVSGWVGKATLALMLGVFAVAWTIADGFSARSSPNTVLSAGGTTVSLQDYRVAYQQATAEVARQLQRRPTPEEAEAFGIDQSTLSQLASGAVLDEQGRALGLGLSEDGLLRLISEDPSFQDSGGNFSRAAFRAILENAGLTETAYLERLGSSALRTQIIDSVSDGLAAPQTFVDALALYAGETRDVSAVSVPAEPSDTIADPSAEDLDAFYTAGMADYAAPEYRAFSYVELDAETVADPGSVTEEQIAAAYEANRADYVVPERRTVRQIVFPDTAAAEAAVAGLAAGQSFEEIAEAAGRTPADTDLGSLTRAEIPDANVADAAFSLAEGAASGVVQGVFGPAILQVTAIEPEGVRPLEEVREELRAELALDASADLVDDAYNVFEDARAGGATLAEAAEEANLPLVSVEAVDAGGLGRDGQPIADLPGGGELVDLLFATEPGFDNAPLNDASNSFVFYDVTAVEPARDRPLDEVRDAVVADWKDEEAGSRLQERVEALRARVEAGESLEGVAAAEGLAVETSAGLTRSSATAALGEAGGRTAFSGPQGLVATTPSAEPGEWLLLQVDAVRPPAPSVPGVPEQQVQQISGTLRNDILQSYVTLLQSEYPVRFNQAAIQTASQALR